MILKISNFAFSVFDGAGASTGPLADFIFFKDETGSDEDDNSPGLDLLEWKKQLDHYDHQESEIPAV